MKCHYEQFVTIMDADQINAHNVTALFTIRNSTLWVLLSEIKG